ncbi:MAG TPA: aminotransferase class I/II-fold pyridoxal phosphate-dependent enzyme [bacterium]|nr:aminotransferase class I/II-fold pyridoxal phosphate-dependent enzyme [bacterium]
MTDAPEQRRVGPPPSRPWVPSAADAWYARLADEAAVLDPAALVARVEHWVEHQAWWTDDTCINLNAATNIMSPRARALMGSTLGPRPSLGYAGDKYETGLADTERIEVVAAELARALFHAAFAEIRVLSGSLANLYAFMAIARPGDAVMVVPESAAGHATHHAHGAAGLYGLTIHDIPFDPVAMNVDVDGLARRARDVRPAVVLVGASLVLFPYDLAAVRRIADDVGARVMFDAAHVAGLIAGGAFPSPLDHGADVLTMSTYKSFGGPPGGVVLTNDAGIAERLDRIAYPGLSANTDLGRIAALAVAEADLLAHGPAYARRCVENAQALGAALGAEGFAVLGERMGYTRSHHVAVDARPLGGGTKTARRLEPANILATGIPLPIPAVAGDYNGLRLGTQEVTRWGMGPAEMAHVAQLMARLLLRGEHAAAVARDAAALRAAFRTVGFCIDA